MLPSVRSKWKSIGPGSLHRPCTGRRILGIHNNATRIKGNSQTYGKDRNDRSPTYSITISPVDTKRETGPADRSCGERKTTPQFTRC